MKLLATLLLVLVPFSSMAQDLWGDWSGRGYVDDGSLNAPVEGAFDLRIEKKNGRLEILSCYEVKIDLEIIGRCSQSYYELKNESEIWSRGRKIGDIYPFEIVLLEANEQVSEQMVFKYLPGGQMRFGYSYSNMDGGSEYQRAVLDPIR